jgi:Spy/CpxP family protein refolding chaperone
MPRSKVSAFLSVLVVFASGAAMGAVGYRLYSVKAASSSSAPPSAPGKRSPEEFRKLIVNSLKDGVKLDDQQSAEVQKLYQDQHEGFDQIHDKYQAQVDGLPAVQQIHQEARHEIDQMHDSMVAKINALLRPEQQALYAKWQADRAADRKRREQQKHDHPDGKQRPPMPRPLP